MKSPALKIDLFCRVVDNFGDIGVCWRLARQLVAEQNCQVNLIVDDLSVFKKLETRVDENAALQTLAGVRILQWQDEVLLQHLPTLGDAVIEAFACDLPSLILEKLARQSKAPVWIDFEYLSAENWVDSTHAIPSLHPRINIKKTLFFPGFSEKTGGLIRERELITERSKFCADAGLQKRWREEQGIPRRHPEITDISLFCYPDAPLEKLITDLSEHEQKIRLFVPQGIAAAKLAAYGKELGSLTIETIPFLPQTEYDRLLWACDLNFVRGEDSWIRALWAGKPFIWQAYPQENGVSHVKLDAFLGRYMQGITPSGAESLADFHAMWNLSGREGKSGSRSWRDLLVQLPDLTTHALAWADRQAEQDDCATQLTQFIRSQI